MSLIEKKLKLPENNRGLSGILHLWWDIYNHLKKMTEISVYYHWKILWCFAEGKEWISNRIYNKMVFNIVEKLWVYVYSVDTFY